MFILGKKMRMTAIWQGQKQVPVTVIKAEPNTISGIRTKEKDGYEAVQVVSGRSKREFRLSKPAELKAGDQITVSQFEEGSRVAVSGVTKGRGFQGVVKRHGFHGGPKTHGQKNRLRAPGSIGSTAPQRVFPGRRMAGHMGDVQVTIKNLVVAAIRPDENTILLRGAVPGAPGTLVLLRTGTRLSSSKS